MLTNKPGTSNRGPRIEAAVLVRGFTFSLRPALAVAGDFLSLTKPRVISLLLLTTLAAMLLASQTLPAPGTVVATLVGGFLAAGAAGALNCYFDRDIDGVMSRTRRRPLPSGRLAPAQALWFGLALAVLSLLVLWRGANLTAALLAQAGIVYYVVIYTLWLKRTSVQNIVIGGGAGAIPPLVGWAAVTGGLSPLAIALFIIIFCWTPPHFWALALVRRQEYARAEVPMLPVVAGVPSATRHILGYTALLVAISLLPPALGWMGAAYALAAGLLGGLFLIYATRLWQHPSPRAAWRLYGYSLVYLALLFIAMAADHWLVR